MEDCLSYGSSIADSDFEEVSSDFISDQSRDLDDDYKSDRELRYIRRTNNRVVEASNPATLSEHSNESDESDGDEIPSSTTMAKTYNFALFTPWDAKFLDPTDSTLSKLLVKEGTFDEKKEKYNMEPKLFESYRLALQAKSERCSLKSILDVEDSSNKKIDLITQHTLLTAANVTAAADDIWKDFDSALSDDDKCVIHNQRIKRNMLGEYILSSLTDSAIRKLQNSKNEWKRLRDGKVCYDGPTLLYYLMARVKPDNGHLIDDAKTKLTKLNVKNFNFSIINMLTEFVNLIDEIGNLGGTISNEEQAYYFWLCVKTMKEQRFSYFCHGEHDQYRAAIGTAKPSLTSLIEKFKAKEVNMKGEGSWNKPTPEQAQIISLAAMIQGGSKSSKGSGKNKGGQSNSTAENDSEPSKKKKDRGVQPWMLIAPKNGEAKTLTKNDKEYHWCPKCAKGAGQWVRHKPSDHTDNFKASSKSNNSDGGDGSKKKKKQKSNSGNSASSSSASSSTDGGNNLRFNRSALMSVAAGNNADTQAFLSQFIPGNE